MKVIVDAMGGDFAPEQIVLGAYEAAKDKIADIILVGDENEIRKAAQKNGITDIDAFLSIRHANSSISMEDSPMSVVREKKDSSMTIGLNMLSEGEGDAMVSAGNTGALHVGASLIIRKIKGVQRAAIGSVLPFANPTFLIDSGANIELTPENMKQLGIMGSLYMQLVFDVKEPRVALLNIGTEKTKGTKTLIEAYDLLEKTENINFIGNLEGRRVPYGDCDVIVTDGFTGNVFLKTCEGMAFYMFKQIKQVFNLNPMSKISGLVMKKNLYNMKEKYNTAKYGGAPILGLKKIVIKAHGSADKKSIYNAVKQAVKLDKGEVIAKIENFHGLFDHSNSTNDNGME